MDLLEIKNLHVHYITKEATYKAVNGISFSIGRGETLGLVGETGAGKTTTALSIMRLIPDPPGKIMEGEIFYNGENILNLNDSHMRKIRGNEISMIFQDPMTALNPTIRVVDQIAESLSLHGKKSKAQAAQEALQMLETVGIDPERGNEYPHQFSGGMKQRVVIAMALACNPKLLLADEPTTALDVTIQKQILVLINNLKRKMGTAVLLITHDLGVVAQTCDKVAIMYAGEIAEIGTAEHIFRNVKHPYTKGLFGSLPSLNNDVRRLNPIPGLMPDPADLPTGCKFSPRCPYATEKCKTEIPDMYEVEPGHFVRCSKCAAQEAMK